MTRLDLSVGLIALALSAIVATATPTPRPVAQDCVLMSWQNEHDEVCTGMVCHDGIFNVNCVPGMVK